MITYFIHQILEKKIFLFKHAQSLTHLSNYIKQSFDVCIYLFLSAETQPSNLKKFLNVEKKQFF